jgi:hypothetical protein
LASEPNETNSRDESNFSHTLVRRLSAEQLLDCQSEVIGAPLKFAGFPKGLRAAQLPGVRPESKDKRRANASDQFLEIFGKPPRLLNTDTEVTVQLTKQWRDIRLVRGEALFEVAHDKARPFVVAANDTAVRAVGTAFAVRLEATQVDITVTEGVVEVAEPVKASGANAGAPPMLHSETRRVSANERIVIASARATKISPIAPAEAAKTTRKRTARVVKTVQKTPT